MAGIAFRSSRLPTTVPTADRPRRSYLWATLALAWGCSNAPASSDVSAPPEVAPTPPAAAATPAPAPANPPCDSDADCTAQAKALENAGDLPAAREMWTAGCDADGLASCERLANSFASEDPKKAMELWGAACDREYTNACFNAAENARESEPALAVSFYTRACASAAKQDDKMARGLACQRGSATAYGARDFAAARTMAEIQCDQDTTSGCGLLGVLYAKGLGVEADADRSRSLLDQGCKGGDTEACKNLAVLERSMKSAAVANVLPVDGANVSIGSIGVDGLSATDLQCRRDGGGGLFGGAMGAISGIAKRKGKLLKCASEPEDVRVRWSASKGKIKSVEVKASSPKVEACVKKAVRGAAAAFGGTCAATFAIGG